MREEVLRMARESAEGFKVLKAILTELLPEAEILFAATILAERLPEQLRPEGKFARVAARIVTANAEETAYLLSQTGCFEEVARNVFRFSGGNHLVVIQRQSNQAPEAPEAPPPQPQKKRTKSSLPS
jgi:hypothetical protein